MQITLNKLINSTPVAELTRELWITQGKKVLPKQFNEFAEYELTDNPNPSKLEISPEEYNELTAFYYATMPKDLDKYPKPIEKHLAGQHDQSTHGRRASVETIEFSDNEKSAISAYSGQAALQINAKLRGQKPARIGVWQMSDSKIDEAIDNLDSAIGKSKLSKKLTLERDLPATSLRSGLFGSAVGKTITDKGYLSLRNQKSEIPPIKGFVKFIVNAPAGTTGLDLSFINPDAMNEIIFPRGTKIKINSVTGFGEDTIVRGEIVE